MQNTNTLRTFTFVVWMPERQEAETRQVVAANLVAAEDFVRNPGEEVLAAQQVW